MSEFEDLKVSLANERMNRPVGRERTQTTLNQSSPKNTEGRRRTVSSPLGFKRKGGEPIKIAQRSVLQWTVEDVAMWLAMNSFGEYQELFKREQIDGEALMALTETDMKDLNIKMGHRKKINLLLNRFEERPAILVNISKEEDVQYERSHSNIENVQYERSHSNIENVQYERSHSNIEDVRYERTHSNNEDAQYERTFSNNEDLDDLIIQLSGLTAVDALAELESADVDSFLAILSKQLE